MQGKLQKYIGFAFAAKKLVLGTDLVLASIRRRQAKLVLLAADVSARTTKQVLDKSSFYGVDVVSTDCTMEELARAVGKEAPIAAVAVTDKEFAAAIRQSLKKSNPPAAADDRISKN